MNQSSSGGIRVALDLSKVYKGIKKKCYYFIDTTKIRFVRDVCVDIKSRFGISNPISFEINGHYIPQNEDIRVLCNEDVIKIFETNKRKGNLNSLNINDENEGQEDFENGGKSVPNTCSGVKLKRPNLNEEIGNDEMTAVSKLKKKRRTENVNLKEDTDNLAESVKKSKKCAKNKIQTSEFSNVELEALLTEIERSTEMSNMSDNNAKLIKTSKEEKDKPTSNIKEKTPLKGVKVQVKDFDVGNKLDTLHDQTCLDSKTVSSLPEYNRNCQENHNNNLDTTKKDCPQDIVKISNKLEDRVRQKNLRGRRERTLKLINLSSDESSIAESFPATSLVDSSLKTVTHIKYSDNGETDNNSSENNSSTVGTPIGVTFNNELVSNNCIPTSSSTPVILESEKINKLTNGETEFLKYPLLSTLKDPHPKVNDTVAFKKWKMDANYCPGLSDFITAKILQVSENENYIKLKILSGHSEFKEPNGKFSLEQEEENEKSEQSNQNEISEIEMDVSDLLETRIMFR